MNEVLDSLRLSDVPAAAVTERADVVCVGGGPAGIGAAIAAARCGARTILLERNSFLGGTATAGMMGALYGHARTSGVGREMVRRILAAGGGGVWDGKPDVVAVDIEVLKDVALEMAVEAGVQLLLYTVASQPVLESNRVVGIAVENKTGRRVILGKAIVDATGDADVISRSGGASTKGRQEDRKMRPVTLIFKIGGIAFDRLLAYAAAHPDQIQPQWRDSYAGDRSVLTRISGFYDLVSQARERGEIDRNCFYLRLEDCWIQRGTALINTVRVYDVDGTDTVDLTRGELEARRQARRLVAFLKKDVPGCERCYLEQSASNMGVRETRHIIGDHVLNRDEVRSQTTFPDVVLSFPVRLPVYRAGEVEFHSADGQEGSEADVAERNPASMRHEAGVMNIPYRVWLPQDLEGILVAGRPISVTHELDGFTRPILVCTLTGQVAGVAAALTARRGDGPRQIQVRDLRNALSGQGVACALE